MATSASSPRPGSRPSSASPPTPPFDHGRQTVRRPGARGRRGVRPVWHLLEVLIRHPGKLLSQRQLLAEVWGPGYETAGRNLMAYMAQLRRKLEPDPGRPRHLLTEPGMGYRFQPDGARA